MLGRLFNFTRGPIKPGLPRDVYRTAAVRSDDEVFSSRRGYHQRILAGVTLILGTTQLNDTMIDSLSGHPSTQCEINNLYENSGGLYEYAGEEKIAKTEAEDTFEDVASSKLDEDLSFYGPTLDLYFTSLPPIQVNPYTEFRRDEKARCYAPTLKFDEYFQELFPLKENQDLYMQPYDKPQRTSSLYGMLWEEVVQQSSYSDQACYGGLSKSMYIKDYSCISVAALP